MNLHGNHLLSIQDVSRQDMEELFSLARVLEPVARGEMQTHILDGAIMGSMFFESSTRTRLSFDSAFMRLGGRVSHFNGIAASSMSKGETIYDTSCVTSGFYDLFVIRHPEAQAIKDFAAATNVPVINGGSGTEEHPTQALLDIYTIEKELKKVSKTIDGAKVALVGDLKYGRTSHSLVHALSMFSGIEFLLVSPEQLTLPAEVVEHAERYGHRVRQADSLEDALREADIVYGTRLQQERLSAADKGIAIGEEFAIRQNIITNVAKKDVVIMHPLPRDNRPGDFTLSDDLNSDPHLAIFRQSDNGVPIRMSLISHIMGVDQQIESSLKKVDWFKPQPRRRNDLSL